MSEEHFKEAFEDELASFILQRKQNKVRSKQAYAVVDKSIGKLEALNTSKSELHGTLIESGVVCKMTSHNQLDYRSLNNFIKKQKTDLCINYDVIKLTNLG